eukprot:4066923-Pyramimonas_sp.AAC.1
MLPRPIPPSAFLLLLLIFLLFLIIFGIVFMLLSILLIWFASSCGPSSGCRVALRLARVARIGISGTGRALGASLISADAPRVA